MRVFARIAIFSLGFLFVIPAFGGHLSDSLRTLGNDMYQKASESERMKANYTFIRTLVGVLKQPYSFDVPLRESLDMISIQESPDRTFRIFSWNIRLSDGSYRYYGTIQIRTADGTLKLHPLTDNSYRIAQAEKAITGIEDWYGAQYYDIIPHAGSYLLLGWRGHNARISQRVIDVLTFDKADDRVVFGKTLFDANGYRDCSRLIFRFAAGISMHLSYQPEANRIVFDHLVPADPRYEGQFEFYGPDLTFDAWILEREKLRLVEKVDYQ